MAGGIGSRFWPMSQESHPKQFLDVLGRSDINTNDLSPFAPIGARQPNIRGH